MGLNSMGFRTDPGPQVVKLSLLRAFGRCDQKEMEDFISSGAPPPKFRVVWHEPHQLYLLEDPSVKEMAAFSALQYLGYSFVDVIVLGEEKPFSGLEIEEEEEEQDAA